MTQLELETLITKRVRDTTTATKTIVREYAQDVLDLMLMRMGPTVLEREGEILTESGRSTYALRPDVAKVLPPMRISTLNRTIVPEDFDKLDRWALGTATGIPQNYYIYGSKGVTRQPESKIRLVSDSASDTQKVSIYGISGGRATSESVTMTGTTAILTSNTYSRLTDLPTAASVAIGTITATANSTTAQSSYPTVANAGGNTVFTIKVAATQPTNLHSPGSLVRLTMGTEFDSGNPAGDQSGAVIIEGYVVDVSDASSNDFNIIYARESVSTDGTNPQTTATVGTLRFIEIISVSKSWDSTNSLIVSIDPEIIVAMIPPEKRTQNYPQITFYPQPSSSYGIRYRYVSEHPKLGTTITTTDAYQPPWARRFDNIWLEYTEKMVRAFKQNSVFDLRQDAGFVSAMTDALRDDERGDQIIMGSGWQSTLDHPMDYPITVS